MLDVHPPHHPTHTWTDFFIHIATIVVGLIIAVGLEQGVEAVHNNHLRHELQQQLRDQSEGNNVYVTEDVRITEAYYDWAAQQQHTLSTTPPAAPVSIARIPVGELLFPDIGVWLSAKDNGRTALLPAEQQVWYSDYYRIEQRTFAPGIGAHDRLKAALATLDDTLTPLVADSGKDSVTLRPLSAADRTEIAHALQAVQGASREMERELLMFENANRFVHETPDGHWFDAILNGEYLKNRLHAYATHPHSQYVFSAR